MKKFELRVIIDAKPDSPLSKAEGTILLNCVPEKGDCIDFSIDICDILFGVKVDSLLCTTVSCRTFIVGSPIIELICTADNH